MRSNHRLAQLWLDALATSSGPPPAPSRPIPRISTALVWLDENSLGLDEVGLERIRDYIAVLDHVATPALPLPDASQWRAACTSS